MTSEPSAVEDHSITTPESTDDCTGLRLTMQQLENLNAECAAEGLIDGEEQQQLNLSVASLAEEFDFEVVDHGGDFKWAKKSARLPAPGEDGISQEHFASKNEENEHELVAGVGPANSTESVAESDSELGSPNFTSDDVDESSATSSSIPSHQFDCGCYSMHGPLARAASLTRNSGNAIKHELGTCPYVVNKIARVRVKDTPTAVADRLQFKRPTGADVCLIAFTFILSMMSAATIMLPGFLMYRHFALNCRPCTLGDLAAVAETLPELPKPSVWTCATRPFYGTSADAGTSHTLHRMYECMKGSSTVESLSISVDASQKTLSNAASAVQNAAKRSAGNIQHASKRVWNAAVMPVSQVVGRAMDSYAQLQCAYMLRGVALVRDAYAATLDTAAGSLQSAQSAGSGWIYRAHDRVLKATSICVDEVKRASTVVVHTSKTGWDGLKAFFWSKEKNLKHPQVTNTPPLVTEQNSKSTAFVTRIKKFFYDLVKSIDDRAHSKPPTKVSPVPVQQQAVKTSASWYQNMKSPAAKKVDHVKNWWSPRRQADVKVIVKDTNEKETRMEVDRTGDGTVDMTVHMS